MSRKFVDISNKKFGRLTAIRVYARTPDGKLIWECKCDCGRLTSGSGCNIRSGNIKSCGCLKKEILRDSPFKLKGKRKLKKRTGTLNISGRYWSALKHSAKIRKKEFNITLDYIQKLLENQKFKCAISGEMLVMDSNNTITNGATTRNTASLDRVDPTKGYIKGNVQWVHKDVNFMKLDFTNEEFILWCNKITLNNIPNSSNIIETKNATPKES